MTRHHPNEPVAVAAYLLDLDISTWRLACDALIQPGSIDWLTIVNRTGQHFAQEICDTTGIMFTPVMIMPQCVLFCSLAADDHETHHLHISIVAGSLTEQINFQRQLSANLERIQ